MTSEEIRDRIANPPPHYRNYAPDDKDDHLRDECGVFGIYGHPEAANMIISHLSTDS